LVAAAAEKQVAFDKEEAAKEKAAGVEKKAAELKADDKVK
jgi:hypothetical protein